MSFTLEYIVMDSAKWCDYEQTLVECQVKFNELNEILPFSAKEVDEHPHVEDVWQKVVVEGVAGVITAYSDNAERQALVDEIKGWDDTYDQAIVDYGQEGFVSYDDLVAVWNEKRPAEVE